MLFTNYSNVQLLYAVSHFLGGKHVLDHCFGFNKHLKLAVAENPQLWSTEKNHQVI
jgi:hypothetical protein